MARRIQRMKKALVILFLLSVIRAAARDPGVDPPSRPPVDEWYERDRAAHGKNPEMFVRPGLVADRKLRRVDVYAAATGIQAGNPVEFFLIGEKSGHDYESFALSFAAPSDIHRALEFIGMTAGNPVDPQSLRFHPRGERVFMSFLRAGGAETRMERVVLDGTTGNPLPETGFVFVGSRWVDDQLRPGGDRYLADVQDPRSIASDYNEPGTVLDVPRQAAQGTFYRDHTVHPDVVCEEGTRLTVRIVPEYPPDRKRVVDIVLEISGGEDGAAHRMADLLFRLRLSTSPELLAEGLNPVLARFTALGEEGLDPFVALHFGETVSVGAARDVARLFSKIDSGTGIRIEPPEKGHLYYRAFSPDELFRDRSRRAAQPWELHLSMTEGTVSGVLTQIREIWEEQQLRPDLEIRHHQTPTPEILKAVLEKEGPGLPVVLVFVPPALSYGQLMRFVRPIMGTHPTIHVFVDHQAGT